MSVRTWAVAGAAALALTVGAAAPGMAAGGTQGGGTAGAGATTCSNWRTVKIIGATMKYMECRRTYGGRVQSSTALYLWDRGYGEDPYGTVKIGRWEATWTWNEAQGAHSPKYISGWHYGRDAKVYLDTH
ncbi:hypothetical protein [Streptomyces sp. MZ04]|uniref:hypothetical protein n=1 Tax=Streptomyces sp. MZ04 TaxID=2559236 RepID=UPI00107EB685|nr:hypothetical protein [Streptomyces sp. MZ04]TGB16030.1 hypothetical protein E2651_00835 [Streptomyces sp. MZ04]